jgi:hypothetical protein
MASMYARDDAATQFFLMIQLKLAVILFLPLTY